MYDKIYEKDKYIIFRVKNGFVVYNTRKKFEDGHTHLKNYNACVSAINLCIKCKIPRNKSYYFLRSLSRISNDEYYSNEISSLIDVKKSKSNLNYRNKIKKNR